MCYGKGGEEVSIICPDNDDDDDDDETGTEASLVYPWKEKLPSDREMESRQTELTDLRQYTQAVGKS